MSQAYEIIIYRVCKYVTRLLEIVYPEVVYKEDV